MSGHPASRPCKSLQLFTNRCLWINVARRSVYHLGKWWSRGIHTHKPTVFLLTSAPLQAPLPSFIKFINRFQKNDSLNFPAISSVIWMTVQCAYSQKSKQGQDHTAKVEDVQSCYQVCTKFFCQIPMIAWPDWVPIWPNILLRWDCI